MDRANRKLMTRDKEKEKKQKLTEVEKPAGKIQSVYIYDPETGEWKASNPSGSLAYNYLSRDEWGWLD